MFINPRTKAMISILSLYKYDNTLFDLLTLPDGINKELAVNKILQDTANYESFYTDPEYLKFSIKLWGDVNYWSFKKLYDTLNFDYNPIWNKDGTITETRERNESESGSTQHTGTAEDGTETSNTRENGTKIATITETQTAGQEINDTAKTQTTSTTESGADSRTVTTAKTTETDTTEDTTVESGIAGFNSADYAKNEKTETARTVGTDTTENGTETTAGTTNKTGSGTVSETESINGAKNETTNGTETTDGTETAVEKGSTTRRAAETGTDEHTRTTGETERYERTERGNIGITTTQQMIKEEREVSMFKIYDYIVSDFLKNFCIITS